MKKGIILLFCIMMSWGLHINDTLAACRSGDTACEERAAASAANDAALKKSDDAADAAKASKNAVPYDEFKGVDKAVYDNAINDGKTPAEASAAAGGYTPGVAGSSTAGKDYSTNNITGQANADLRDGNVDMYTIPLMIVAVTEMLIKIAGTIAILALVYHSIQMQINSGITGDSSGVDKAKKGMIGSLIGFVVAVSAWFLVTRALDLLSAL